MWHWEQVGKSTTYVAKQVSVNRFRVFYFATQYEAALKQIKIFNNLADSIFENNTQTISIIWQNVKERIILTETWLMKHRDSLVVLVSKILSKRLLNVTICFKAASFWDKFETFRAVYANDLSYKVVDYTICSQWLTCYAAVMKSFLLSLCFKTSFIAEEKRPSISCLHPGF